jgi:hypothetical protein
MRRILPFFLGQQIQENLAEKLYKLWCNQLTVIGGGHYRKYGPYDGKEWSVSSGFDFSLPIAFSWATKIKKKLSIQSQQITKKQKNTKNTREEHEWNHKHKHGILQHPQIPTTLDSPLSQTITQIKITPPLVLTPAPAPAQAQPPTQAQHSKCEQVFTGNVWEDKASAHTVTFFDSHVTQFYDDPFSSEDLFSGTFMREVDDFCRSLNQ